MRKGGWKEGKGEIIGPENIKLKIDGKSTSWIYRMLK